MSAVQFSKTPVMNVESDHPKLVRRILGTFKEMPGVQLSLQEAERMFGLRESTCRALLEQLVGEKSLRRTTDGRYAIA